MYSRGLSSVFPWLILQVTSTSRCTMELSLGRTSGLSPIVKVVRSTSAVCIACIFCNAVPNVEALSDTRTSTTDLLLQNRQSACRKVPVERSGTISRCTAVVDAHVKRQTYALDCFPFLSRTYEAPVKSTPGIVNGFVSLTRIFDNGGASYVNCLGCCQWFGGVVCLSGYLGY